MDLQIRFAAFAFCFKTDLSGIFVGDTGDGERVAAAAVLGLILQPRRDRNALVKPSHAGVCRRDRTLERGVLPLRRSHVVELGRQANLSRRLKETEGERRKGRLGRGHSLQPDFLTTF